jgi:RNA polymerase sigma-70 factor (ECF subfamily)
MTDDREPLAGELERQRPLLRLLAQLHLPAHLRAKCDASDVVQQTLVKAHQGWGQFRGFTEAELEAWLRRILANTLTDLQRTHGRDRRDAAREQSLEAALERSSFQIKGFLHAHESSPSQRAQRNETLLRLSDALAGMPDDQRRAVELHHLQGLKLGEVAQEMGRSEPSVAGLLRRGLKHLRDCLQTNE